MDTNADYIFFLSSEFNYFKKRYFDMPGSGLNSYTSSRWLFFLELNMSFFYELG